MMVKKLVFLYDSAVKPWRTDLARVQGQLLTLQRRGIPCHIIDTARMSSEELEEWRHKARFPSIWKHQRIRQAFGSRRIGGLPYFGKQVPALLVYEDDEENPSAVYPHEKTKEATPREVTIERFLDDLLKESE